MQAHSVTCGQIYQKIAKIPNFSAVSSRKSDVFANLIFLMFTEIYRIILVKIISKFTAFDVKQIATIIDKTLDIGITRVRGVRMR